LIHTPDDACGIATCNGCGVRVDGIHQQLHLSGLMPCAISRKVPGSQVGIEAAFRSPGPVRHDGYNVDAKYQTSVKAEIRSRLSGVAL
jgi:hypothetical protein